MDIVTRYANAINDLAKRVRNIEIQLGGGACGIAVARYVRDTAQTINNNTNTTVQYNTMDFDDDSLVTTGASWKFVAPQDNYYVVAGQFSFQAYAGWAHDEHIYARIMVNSVLYSEGAKYAQTTVAGGYRLCVRYADIVPLDRDDELRIECYQNSGGNLNLEADGDINYVVISLL